MSDESEHESEHGPGRLSAGDRRGAQAPRIDPISCPHNNTLAATGRNRWPTTATRISGACA